MNPVVSVVINTYNYGRFIEETIESALAQDFPADQMEIVVVDDGSTDDTADRVRKYGDRVRYFYKANGDQCSAVPFGVARAKGQIVALLDGDDLWLPNKISLVVQEFAKDPRLVMVYHRYIFWDAHSGNTWEHPYFAEVSGDVLADRRKLLSYMGAPTSSLAFRRDCFQALTTIPAGRTFSYDAFLFTAVLFLGPISCIPAVLTKNRVHGENRWAQQEGRLDIEKIKRHVARRKAMTEILRDWIRANAPKSARRQARILLCRARWVEDINEFAFAPPNRVRRFQHACRCALLEEPTTRAHIAYRYTHAFAGLIVGRHARYLEGIRTRVNRARARRTGAEPANEAAGPV